MLFQGEHDKQKVAARVSYLFDVVGLPQVYAQRHPHEISGGQCQRVGIARALALEPSFVILDEAVSSLDVSVRSQILNLLRRLQRDLGLTYMFVSHDIAVIRYMANTLAVMYAGRIVERGPREQLFGMPQHPYTHALMGAIPVPDPERARRRGSCRWIVQFSRGTGGLPLRASVPDRALARSSARRLTRRWRGLEARRGMPFPADGRKPGCGRRDRGGHRLRQWRWSDPARPTSHRHSGRGMNRTLDVALLFDVEDVFHPPEVGNDDIIMSLADALSAERVLANFLFIGRRAELLGERGGAMSSRPSGDRGRTSHAVRCSSDDA
jgi:hypothetical protein